jgi:hypothetical protein
MSLSPSVQGHDYFYGLLRDPIGELSVFKLISPYASLKSEEWENPH